MNNIITQLVPNIETMFISAKTNDVFFEIGAIIIIATILAFISNKLKQPLIPAYIVAGLLLGPIYSLVTHKEIITNLSEIGIAFLLFIVGLEIDLKKLKDVSIVAGLGGTIRSLSMFTIGFIIALILGFAQKEAAYIGIIIAFSSTMVVVKLLSDKRELDTLHGRIIVGILLLEDLLAILVLSVITSLDGNSFATATFSLIKGIVLLLVTLISTKYLFPKLFKISAKNQELLFLSSIAVCFLFSIIAYYLNFSIAIGAFLAGLSLANLPYNLVIIGKVASLKNFFSTIFFVSLGMELKVDSIKILMIPLIVLLFLVIFIKPLITMFLCSFFGYKKRVGFITSISLAQISEFSLIIVAQGLLLGHVSRNILTLTILVAITTMTITSYFVKFDNGIYSRLKPCLKPFDKFTQKYKELEYMPRKRRVEVILCGHDRLGYSIGRTIEKLGKRLLVIDYNPEIIKALIKKKIPCLYGDISDMELLERLPFKNAEMVISTVPSSRVNKVLIEKVKEINKKAIVYVTTTSVEKALELYGHGADYVVLPHFLGGEHVSLLIEKFKGDIDKIIKNKTKHIEELKHRQSIGHEHPRHNNHEND